MNCPDCTWRRRRRVARMSGILASACLRAMRDLRTAHGLDLGADIVCCDCTKTGRGTERSLGSRPPPPLWGRLGRGSRGSWRLSNAPLLSCHEGRGDPLPLILPARGRRRVRDGPHVNSRARGPGRDASQVGRLARLKRRRGLQSRAALVPFAPYSTVTDFARLRGWSASLPIMTAVW